MALLSFARCLGINNRKPTEDLKAPSIWRPGIDDDGISYEVSEATNCEVDTALSLSRRSGYTLTSSSAPHSLWATLDGNYAYCILGNDLCSFPDFSVVAAGVGASEMSFQETPKFIFFTNGAVIGYIQNRTAYAVPSPTELNRVRIFPGSCLDFYKARLFWAVANVLYFSDAFKLFQTDLRYNFKQFPADIDLIAAGEYGVWVAAGTRTYYLSGNNPHQFTATEVAPYGAKRGSKTYVDGQKIRGDLGKRTPVWASHEGIVVGTPTGDLINLTNEKYIMPDGSKAALVARDRKDTGAGYLQLITSLR